jgi:clan AA aspartic protease
VIGTVDELGRALVTLTIRANQDAEPTNIQAWIDTAFNGELVMPSRMIEAAQLEQTAGIEARLADGNAVTLESFTCILDWFGEDRAIEVIANNGEYPLLGIGLLVGHRLIVDYTQLTVTIE